jgi:hypothetical protein
MSEPSYSSDSGDSVGQESPVTSPRRNSSVVHDSSLLEDPMTPGDEPDPITSFPLMKLPPELRLNIYDQLFLDLTIGRQRKVADLNKYHRPDEWPDNNFSDYLNLLLTCKEIYHSAKGLWDKVYIPKFCFYFWKMPDFHRVASALVKLGGSYQSARYALRIRTLDEIGLEAADFIDLEGSGFMSCQPGFPNDDSDYSEFHWSWPELPYASRSGTHTLYTDGGVPVETYRQGPKRKKFGRAQFPGLQGCSIAVHDRHVPRGYRDTSYLLMSGEVCNIFWDGYDADLQLGKQLIWDKWERRGFPSSGRARREIIMLLRDQLAPGMRRGLPPSGRGALRMLKWIMHEVKKAYDLGSWLPDFHA